MCMFLSPCPGQPSANNVSPSDKFLVMNYDVFNTQYTNTWESMYEFRLFSCQCFIFTCVCVIVLEYLWLCVFDTLLFLVKKCKIVRLGITILCGNLYLLTMSVLGLIAQCWHYGLYNIFLPLLKLELVS